MLNIVVIKYCGVRTFPVLDDEYMKNKKSAPNASVYNVALFVPTCFTAILTVFLLYCSENGEFAEVCRSKIEWMLQGTELTFSPLYELVSLGCSKVILA